MTDRGILVNDVHAQLNATLVQRVLRPASVADVRDAVLAAGAAGRAMAIAGGRHAMGGQQFGAGLDLLDMTGLDRVLGFDSERGELEADVETVQSLPDQPGRRDQRPEPDQPALAEADAQPDVSPDPARCRCGRVHHDEEQRAMCEWAYQMASQPVRLC